MDRLKTDLGMIFARAGLPCLALSRKHSGEDNRYANIGQNGCKKTIRFFIIDSNEDQKIEQLP